MFVPLLKAYGTYSFFKMIAMSSYLVHMAGILKGSIDAAYEQPGRCSYCYQLQQNVTLALEQTDVAPPLWEFGYCSEEYENKGFERSDYLLWTSELFNFQPSSNVSSFVWYSVIALIMSLIFAPIILLLSWKAPNAVVLMAIARLNLLSGLLCMACSTLIFSLYPFLSVEQLTKDDPTKSNNFASNVGTCYITTFPTGLSHVRDIGLFIIVIALFSLDRLNRAIQRRTLLIVLGVVCCVAIVYTYLCFLGAVNLSQETEPGDSTQFFFTLWCVWCILEPMLVVAKLLSYLRRQAENLGDQLQARNHQQGQLAANLNPSINQSTSGVGRRMNQGLDKDFDFDSLSA